MKTFTESSNYQHVLAIDIESYSSNDLKTGGVYKYVDAPDFTITLFGYSLDGAPVEVIELVNGNDLPEHLLVLLADRHTLKTAFNAQFERICLNRYTGLNTGPWECTMIRAYEAGYSGSLKDVGAALKLPEDVRKTNGLKLIKLFAMPPEQAPREHKSVKTPEERAALWAEYVEYNRRDVIAEMAIREKLKAIPMKASEQRLWELDQLINDNGILIDGDMCEAAIAISDTLTNRGREEFQRLTGIDSPAKTAALKAWLKEKTGKDIPELRKESLGELIEALDGYPDAQRAVNIRFELARASVKKYQKMLDTQCSDGRSRGNLQFFGARTGRWAGRLIQLQNLPQNHLDDLDGVRAAIKWGDADALDLLYGDPMDALRQSIRTAVIPPKGKAFVVADFSAIEARVIAWLSGEKWRIDTFKAGGDIYCESASQMFNVPVVKHGINGHLRQKGKIAELALGYGGSVGALKAMGAIKQGIPEDELQDIVTRWREASPLIVELWHKVQRGVVKVLSNRTLSSSPIAITDRLSASRDPLTGITSIHLPSGRRINYPGLRLEKVEGRNRLIIGVTEEETYYGKLTENIVQATARDLLAESMLRLDDMGYKIVFHVHDEVIIEVDAAAAESELKTVCDVMGMTPEWADGLPLRADGYTCNYYKKD